MFDAVMHEVASARASLETAAGRLDTATLSGPNAVALLSEVGRVRRLADGLMAKAAKRADDTAAHSRGTDRSAAELTARVVGVSPGEAKRAIDTAARLERLPKTDAAVRAGRLSAQQADLIAGAAADDPSIEQDLLAVAGRGMVPLRDAAIAARARREDERGRRARQRKARFHRSWTTADGRRLVPGAARGRRGDEGPARRRHAPHLP